MAITNAINTPNSNGSDRLTQQQRKSKLPQLIHVLRNCNKVVVALCAAVIIVHAYQDRSLKFEWPETLERRSGKFQGTTGQRHLKQPTDKPNDEAAAAAAAAA